MIRTPVRHGYEIEHGLVVDVNDKPVIKIEDFRVRDHIIVALNAYKGSSEDLATEQTIKEAKDGD